MYDPVKSSSLNMPIGTLLISSSPIDFEPKLQNYYFKVSSKIFIVFRNKRFPSKRGGKWFDLIYVNYMESIGKGEQNEYMFDIFADQINEDKI